MPFRDGVYEVVVAPTRDDEGRIVGGLVQTKQITEQRMLEEHEATAGVPGGVAFMVAPTGERLELLVVDVRFSAWEDPIAALRAGVPHTAWTVDDLDAAHARAVEAGGRSVWTPRDTPEPGLRIAFVADPDGNLVEMLSRDGEAPPS
jgi:catechol 2,3-dioxygenase-like lactoylglutathione lyase family enzyme